MNDFFLLLLVLFLLFWAPYWFELASLRLRYELKRRT